MAPQQSLDATHQQIKTEKYHVKLIVSCNKYITVHRTAGFGERH